MRVTARLARRFGAEAPTVWVASPRRRSLAALARENAVEGCVRETFGAMVATWQATHAADPDVRKCMVAIAADETRHAALAWAIAGWAHPRLNAHERARVVRARRVAARTLKREAAAEPPCSVSRTAGLPSARETRAIVDALTEEVWA